MNLDLKRLRKLAELATRGDWMSTGVVVCAPAEGGMEYLVEQCHGTDSPNLEFIASANPDVVLQLLDLLQKCGHHTHQPRLGDTELPVGVERAIEKRTELKESRLSKQERQCFNDWRNPK